MQCVSPFAMKAANGNPAMDVPCGKCVACRIARQREWAVRMLHEYSTSDSAVFVTLTYNDESLPEDCSLSKRELQLFFKRLRKALPKRNIRYFACGEYGDENGRPHYHGIFYNIEKFDEDIVYSTWQKGFVQVRTFSFKRAMYVAKYCFKQLDGYVADFKYGNRQRPFRLVSQGLGREFVDRNGDVFRRRLAVRVDGHDLALPRYYRDRLGLDKSCFIPGALERDAELAEYFTKHALTPFEYNQQRKIILLHKSLGSVAGSKYNSLKAHIERKRRKYWREFTEQFAPQEVIPF